jgi:4-aminobutyrate aminotransferase-like enzyme/Ser/Thr protein kinase RdoA (MazF antagonist)
MNVLQQAPRLDIASAEEVVLRLYGIQPTQSAKQLDSDRDQNFLIQSDDRQFVLKISNASESRDNLVAQNEMMGRIAASEAAFPEATKVIPSLDGNLIEQATADDVSHMVRLVTFVAGTPMAQLNHCGEALLFGLGAAVAGITEALGDYDHPALHRDFNWDLANGLSVVESRLSLIEDPSKRQQIELLLNRFRKQTLPLLQALPKTAIHNDANDGNVIVRAVDDSVVPNRVVSVIDFGDAVYSWTVNELAIAIAYAILEHADPFAAMLQIIDGYQSRRQLCETEASALFGLVCMRLCASAAIAAEQQRQQPDNLYLSVSQAPIANTLPQLLEIPFEFAAATIRKQCGFEANPHGQRVKTWLSDDSRRFVFPIELPSCELSDKSNNINRPAESDLLVLDLGVESPHLIGPDSVTEPVLQRIIDQQLESHSAKVAVGRYLEPRLLYDSELFAADKFERERRTVHLGIDLFAPAGTSVVAPLDGEVVLFDDNNSPLDYGPLIVLKHTTDDGDSFYSLYGHLSRASLESLKLGQKIKAGEAFATLGEPHENVGWPPHLHFQLITDLFDLGSDFPGVCRASRIETWQEFCPDPNLVLRISDDLFPQSASPKTKTAEKRKARMGANLSIGYHEPVKTVRGWKQYLYDENGRKYIDGYNNVPHVGHCHPRVVDALHTQARKLNTNTRYLSDTVVEYAEALAATMPDGIEVCYFLNSASEANELALRLARAKSGGKDLVVLEGAYHGHSTSLIEISPYKHDGPGGNGAPDWVHTAPVADIYRGDFKDPKTAGHQYAAAVGEIIQRLQRDGRQLCGFIAESWPSVGGQIMFPEGYLAEVYRLVREAGGVCIADDVQTGYGRLGKWFYGFEQQNVSPDIVVLGKPIGNGHPIAALATTREIADVFDNGMEFFSTFGGNTVSSVVGKTVLEIVKDESLPEHADKVGEFLLAGLRDMQSRHSIIGDVRGSGLFLGVELVRDHETLEPADCETSYVANRMRERGILIGTDGPLHNVLKIRPPMPFTMQDAEILLEQLDATFSELSPGRV